MHPATVSSAHPFSDPKYYPLHQPMKVDCVKGNPGCPGYHTVWTMDFSVMRDRSPGNDTIYAMGAGIFHLIRIGYKCNSGHPTSFGTTVEIDHGGGVVSRYGHLSSVLATDGHLVAAGQAIGVMGTTGKNANCTLPYLDFQVQRGTALVEFPTLRACDDAGATQIWPVAQYPQYPTWNDVPQSTPMPNPSASFTAPTGSCVPTTAPATPSRPATPAVARSGAHALRVSWTGQPGGTSSMVKLQLFHPSSNTWGTESYRYLAAGRTSTTFSGLGGGRTYRAQVNFHNGVGWSLPSYYRNGIPS